MSVIKEDGLVTADTFRSCVHWEPLWATQSGTRVGGEWAVKLSWDYTHERMLIEVKSTHRECRAEDVFNRQGFIDAGMNSSLDTTLLAKRVKALCKSGLLAITEDCEEGVLNLTLYDQVFGLEDPYPITFVLPCEELTAEAKISRLEARLKRQSKALAKKDAVIIILRRTLQSRDNDIKQLEKDLSEEKELVKRLTEDLGSEVEKRFKSQRELSLITERLIDRGLNGWADEGEVDRLGNPLFIVKLADFVTKPGNPMDLIHAKYLYSNRRRLAANALAAFRYPSGEMTKMNALHWCAKYPCLSSMVSWLLMKGTIDPNERTPDRWKNTALIIAVSKANDTAANLLLNDIRVDKDRPDKDGDTPLIIAAMNNHLSCVSLLLDHGCDPTITNIEGLNALAIAKRYENTEVVSLLRRAETVLIS